MVKIVWLLPLILHINIIFSSINIFTGFVRLADLWGFSFGLYLIWKHTGVLASTSGIIQLECKQEKAWLEPARTAK